MKEIFKKIIIFILKLESKMVLKRFKPKIIGVSGSVGKTSTKDAIFSALSGSLHIRKNQKSFNSEIGVPLTILGLENGYHNLFKWLMNIFEGFLVLFNKKYPKWLVLELGTDHPKDMDKLISWIKIDIAVFTRFPKMPVHVEYFSSPKELNDEDKKMIKGLKKDGHAILNADDSLIMEIKNEIKSRVITYGIDLDADIKASNIEIIYENKYPVGINFKVNFGNNSMPFKILGVLGKQHIYPILIAFACGILNKIDVVKMLNSITNYISAPGRMKILKGINNSTIIDDSYNSSPVAVEEALKVLSKIKNTKSKIVVLGDMSELGRYTANEHKIIGKLICDLKFDYLLTIGKRAEFIVEEALISGMEKEKVFSFETHEKLIFKLKELLDKGSIVLIKGSQTMRMEKIVKEVIENKEKAKELLVRQEDFWIDKN